MRFTATIGTLLLAAALMPASPAAASQGIRIATASNFSTAMKTIVQDFEATTPYEVTLIFGSTGKHYAQIKNGAPYDAFFAADVRRPALLEDEGVAVPGSRFTYAVGKLVLYSPRPDYVDAEGDVLEHGDFRFLAIANPRLAPYGQAARDVLQARGLWDALDRRMVRGENIGQTFQFVMSGNAELGFVAYAQVKRPGESVAGSWWAVPQALYAPIEQQAVLLKENRGARDFLAFVQSPEARRIIHDFGYDTP